MKNVMCISMVFLFSGCSDSGGNNPANAGGDMSQTGGQAGDTNTGGNASTGGNGGSSVGGGGDQGNGGQSGVSGGATDLEDAGIVVSNDASASVDADVTDSGGDSGLTVDPNGDAGQSYYWAKCNLGKVADWNVFYNGDPAQQSITNGCTNPYSMNSVDFTTGVTTSGIGPIGDTQCPPPHVAIESTIDKNCNVHIHSPCTNYNEETIAYDANYKITGDTLNGFVTLTIHRSGGVVCVDYVVLVATRVTDAGTN